MNKLSSVTSTIYGFLLIVGGLIGYFSAHSKMSLITGIASGILIFLSVKLGETNPKGSYLFIASITLVLAIFFSFRLSATHKFMPAGLMLIASTITYVFVAKDWFKSK